MRKDFFLYLYDLMYKNEKLWALTGDLGYGGFDRIRDNMPERFVNCGAAEQAMMDIAVGIALTGNIPVVYSITPFLLYRPFETLRTYINHEKIPVIMIGSGRNDDYKHDGFSHFAGDDIAIMQNLANIKSCHPKDTKEMIKDLEYAINTQTPTYINLVR